MSRILATALVVAVTAALVLSAGCTLTTPGTPGQPLNTTPGSTLTPATSPTSTTCCPCPTVSPTATGGGGGVIVNPTATTVATVTGTRTATITRTATRTATVTPSGPGSVSGVKWNDQNGDHRRDTGEPVLSGWTIRIEMQEANGPNWNEVARTVTGADGAYSFTGLAEGHYRVYEVAQSGWTQTFPTNAEGMHNLVISNGRPSWTGQDFGNTRGAVVSLTATPTATATATATVTSTPTATVMPTATGPGGQVYYADILTARNMAFDKTAFTVPAGATVALTFINDDPGVQHNFALYTDATAATPIFRGGVVTGQITTVYTFTAPSTPGTYFFRCDVHPAQMTGTFVVT